MQNLILAEDSFDRGEVAECGCRLSRNSMGSVSHHFCPLHAAAPALLEALEDLNKVFDFSQRLDPGDFDIEDHSFASAAFAQARAAIEEAKK